MKKFLISLIILSLCSFGFSGCGSKPAPTPNPTPAAQTPKFGGTLKIVILEPSVIGYPATMTGSTDGQTASVAVETLFLFDKDSNVVPWLATAWTADPAAKTLTISLNKGVKFQDGTDFNAEAVKWNLDQYKAGRRPELKKVASVDVVDPYNRTA